MFVLERYWPSSTVKDSGPSLITENEPNLTPCEQRNSFGLNVDTPFQFSKWRDKVGEDYSPNFSLNYREKASRWPPVRSYPPPFLPLHNVHDALRLELKRGVSWTFEPLEFFNLRSAECLGWQDSQELGWRNLSQKIRKKTSDPEPKLNFMKFAGTRAGTN